MKIIKLIMFFIILCTSFYFTHNSALFLRDNDPIMKSIKKYSNTYNTMYVNALIDDNHIIPGIYGKKVNELKSLMKMKEQRAFNSLFLTFDYIKPEVSLEDNKTKIISKGNEKKNSVSFIIESLKSNYINYLKTNNIKCSLLVNLESVIKDSYFEQINNDFENYNEVEKIINKNNTNICLLNRNNKDFCIRSKKYLIEATHILSSSNLVYIKNKITPGDIILIKSNVSLDDLTYLINFIKSRGINIIYLSELISEK